MKGKMKRRWKCECECQTKQTDYNNNNKKQKWSAQRLIKKYCYFYDKGGRCDTLQKSMMNSSFVFKWTIETICFPLVEFIDDDNDDDDKIRREKFAFSAQLRSYNNGLYEELLTNLQLLQMCASQPILSFSIVTKTHSAVFVSHRFFGCVLHHQHHVNNLHSRERRRTTTKNMVHVVENTHTHIGDNHLQTKNRYFCQTFKPLINIRKHKTNAKIHRFGSHFGEI